MDKRGQRKKDFQRNDFGSNVHASNSDSLYLLKSFVIPQGGGGELGGRDWVDNTQIGVESFGLANSSKEQLIKLAAKSDGSINNLKYVKGVKVVGKVAVVGSVALTGYQTYNDIQNGNYYSAATRAAVLGIGLAATAIPVAGWFVAGGIGLADAIWGDQFYNWVELNLRNEP